MKMQYIIAM